MKKAKIYIKNIYILKNTKKTNMGRAKGRKTEERMGK